MGYEITAVLSDGFSIGSVRVGTNGSQEVMFGLWFAAYGVSGLPDSDLVRRGWIRPYGPAAEWHRENHPDRSPTVSDLRSMIGIETGHGDRQSGGYLRPRTGVILQGLRRRPTRCPVLAPIVEFWKDHYGAELSVDLVDQLARSTRTLTPALVASCWYERMSELEELFAKARRLGASCRTG